MWDTYIGNTYRESKTLEKVYIIAGTKCGYREVHIIIVTKALYVIQSSGLQCHERFSGCLRDMGFFV